VPKLPFAFKTAFVQVHLNIALQVALQEGFFKRLGDISSGFSLSQFFPRQ